MVGILNPANVRECFGKGGRIGGGLGYYSGDSATYQTLKSWTVSDGMIGYLDEISFSILAGSVDYVMVKVTIGDTVIAEDLQVIGDVNLMYGGNVVLDAGDVVKIEVKSDGINEIKCNGVVLGREIEC